MRRVTLLIICFKLDTAARNFVPLYTEIAFPYLIEVSIFSLFNIQGKDREGRTFM
jgi:hypothetical protein